MKAIEALNNVWDTLHMLVSYAPLSSKERLKESKRTIEKALMIIDMLDGKVSKDTEL